MDTDSIRAELLTLVGSYDSQTRATALSALLLSDSLASVVAGLTALHDAMPETWQSAYPSYDNIASSIQALTKAVEHTGAVAVALKPR